MDGLPAMEPVGGSPRPGTSGIDLLPGAAQPRRIAHHALSRTGTLRRRMGLRQNVARVAGWALSVGCPQRGMEIRVSIAKVLRRRRGDGCSRPAQYAQPAGFLAHLRSGRIAGDGLDLLGGNSHRPRPCLAAVLQTAAPTPDALHCRFRCESDSAEAGKPVVRWRADISDPP